MNENFYETGNTQPPKSRVWFVLFLVLLIFLGGIITALGTLNIRLWQFLSPHEEEVVSVKFTREENSTLPQFASSPATGNTPSAGLGFATESISAFIRTYYRLPQGVYIPYAPTGSNAASAGILPGDILVALNGEKTPNTNVLTSLLHRYRAGDVVTLTLYRKGETLSVRLTLIEEN